MFLLFCCVGCVTPVCVGGFVGVVDVSIDVSLLLAFVALLSVVV